MKFEKIIFVFLFFIASCGNVIEQKEKIYTDKDYVAIAKYLYSDGEKPEAIEYFQKALNINDKNLQANLNVAMHYFNIKKYEDSLHYFQNVLSELPHDSNILFNIGYIKHNQGAIKDAINYLEESIKIDPNNLSAYKWLAFSYHLNNQRNKAYEIEDALYEKKVLANRIDRQWNGSDLRGKTILIRNNVGIGDIFCFIRYAKMFKEQGATVALEVRPFLIPILSLCPYIDTFVKRFEKIPKFFDEVITISRLPRIVHKAMGKVSAEIPYLYTNKTVEQKWHDILSRDKNFKIGICWDSKRYKIQGTNEVVKNNRAMPLHFFYPFSALKNVSLYSLQQVNGQEQISYMPSDFFIKTFDETFDKQHGSFMDTAAVMKNLDLVITVDTSIAHLAGALGVPVWVILPYVPDWRWLLENSKTDLYPTMQLFRQKKLGDWASAMDEVYVELCALLKK